MKNNQPNYQLIYSDIIMRKFPEKKLQCEKLLQKKKLSVIDILKLNKKVFGSENKEFERLNPKHRSYDKSDIMEILNFQKINKLTNIEVARQFGLSRNSITRWKKIFSD